MQNDEKSVVAQLQAYRAQGLSYYDAVQKLLAAGISQAMIDDAAHSYDYLADKLRTAILTEDPAELQKLAQSVLAADTIASQARARTQRRQNTRWIPMKSGISNMPGRAYFGSWWSMGLIIVIAFVFLAYELRK